jgi:hypothetical protein
MTSTPGMMTLFAGGWQQGKLGGVGGTGGVQHGGGQLHPAIAVVAAAAASAKTIHPPTTARIELKDAFMAGLRYPSPFRASKKGAAPPARRPVLRRSQPGPNLPCKPHAVKVTAKGRRSMFHLNTELLIDYWRARKGSGRAPARASINPAEFPSLLPQVFILGRQRPGQYAFRLVGGLVDELHGGRLGSADPLKLWAPAYRTALQLALEAVRRQPEPLVIAAEARTATGLTLNLEITLAPLTGPSGEIDRLIGLYQPLTPVAVLKGQPIETLVVRNITAAGSVGAEFPRLKLAAVDGRQLA